MSVKPGGTRKRRHKILLGVFVLLGFLAGAGYAVLKPPALTSTAVVVLPSNTHTVATQAVIAGSDPGAGIHPAQHPPGRAAANLA